MKFLHTDDGYIALDDVVKFEEAEECGPGKARYEVLYLDEYRMPRVTHSWRHPGMEGAELLPAFPGWFVIHDENPDGLDPLLAWRVEGVVAEPVSVGSWRWSCDTWAVLSPSGEVYDSEGMVYASRQAYLAARARVPRRAARRAASVDG